MRQFRCTSAGVLDASGKLLRKATLFGTTPHRVHAGPRSIFLESCSAARHRDYPCGDSAELTKTSTRPNTSFQENRCKPSATPPVRRQYGPQNTIRREFLAVQPEMDGGTATEGSRTGWVPCSGCRLQCCAPRAARCASIHPGLHPCPRDPVERRAIDRPLMLLPPL